MYDGVGCIGYDFDVFYMSNHFVDGDLLAFKLLLM